MAQILLWEMDDDFVADVAVDNYCDGDLDSI